DGFHIRRPLELFVDVGAEQQAKQDRHRQPYDHSILVHDFNLPCTADREDFVAAALCRCPSAELTTSSALRRSNPPWISPPPRRKALSKVPDCLAKFSDWRAAQTKKIRAPAPKYCGAFLPLYACDRWRQLPSSPRSSGCQRERTKTSVGPGMRPRRP